MSYGSWCTFYFSNNLAEEERAGCFTFVVVSVWFLCLFLGLQSLIFFVIVVAHHCIVLIVVIPADAMRVLSHIFNIIMP